MNYQQQQPPVLSSDFSTPVSVVSESLSFHASPHAFLVLRGQSSATDKVGQSIPKAVAARILNRRVAILASHSQCTQVLSAGHDSGHDEQENQKPPANLAREASRIHSTIGNGALQADTFAALPAYQQLMADFFPPPNLLLLPHQDHIISRPRWNAYMAAVRDDSQPLLRRIAEEELSGWQSAMHIDLYEAMKTMSWKLLLGMFLGVGPEDELYRSIVDWQEDLLRGQFSLFPVSIKIPFWSSPRAKGIDARKKLQKALHEFFFVQNASPRSSACPFAAAAQTEHVDNTEIASNVLLFTSSIAAKSLASLLTAFILNVFLFKNGSTDQVQTINEAEPSTRAGLLKSILLETERLSPPVIGVMRRVQQDIILSEPEIPMNSDSSNTHNTTQVLVPAGWDAWLYLAGAGRQECDYQNAQQFDPHRFGNSSSTAVSSDATCDKNSPPLPLAFGHGEKSCLGRDVVRDMALAVASTMLDAGLHLTGQVEAPGVLGWLGWRDITTISSEQMAKDMKQLPCQRPRNPIQLVIQKQSSI